MFVAAVIIGAPAASADGSSQPDSQESFRAKIAKSDLRLVKKSYAGLREPELPNGFRLVNASAGGIGVDLAWHRSRDDGFVHLWQTHDASALEDKDPSLLDTGVPITIDGASWIHNTINACEQTTCLSRRFTNGDVVSLNGTLGLAKAETDRSDRVAHVEAHDGAIRGTAQAHPIREAGVRRGNVGIALNLSGGSCVSSW